MNVSDALQFPGIVLGVAVRWTENAATVKSGTESAEGSDQNTMSRSELGYLAVGRITPASKAPLRSHLRIVVT